MNMKSVIQVPRDLAHCCQDYSNQSGRTCVLIAGPITNELVECLYHVLKSESYSDIDVFLHSYGGYAEPAYMTAKIIRDASSTARVIVPRHAKSAATLVCLGMDEIILGPLGELGPIDAQVPEKSDGDVPEHKSALNRFKALENIQEFVAECFHLGANAIAPSRMKASEVAHRASEFAAAVAEPMLRQLSPQRMGEARRALEEGMEYGNRLLTRYVTTSTKTPAEITKRLAFHYPSHGFVLDAVELAEIGLNARAATADEMPLLDRVRVAIGPVAQSASPICAVFAPEEAKTGDVDPTSSDSGVPGELDSKSNGIVEAKPEEAPDEGPEHEPESTDRGAEGVGSARA